MVTTPRGLFLCRAFSTTAGHLPKKDSRYIFLILNAGCSKRPSSKAAASEEARRTLQYVEPLSDARTMLAVFFSILPGGTTSAGTPPLLPTSQNDPSGLGRAEAFWNSFSCDPSIAVLQSVPAFPARMIHEGSTATADTPLRQASMLIIHILAGGLAPPDLDVLLRVRLGLSGLHAPVSLGVSTVS